MTTSHIPLIIQTARQRANTLFARDIMWPSVPEACVSPELTKWRARRTNGSPHDWTLRNRKVVDCKTIACFGGWVAVNPYFVKQGVYPDPNEFYPQMKLRNGDHLIFSTCVSEQLFGHSDMFAAKGAFVVDRNQSDHNAVLARLDWLVEISVVGRKAK